MIINNHYAVIDTETGGFTEGRNPICEIAFVVLDKDFKEVDRFSKIIKPYGGDDKGVREYAPQALAVNGIKMSEIEAGVDIKAALQETESILKKYCKGRGGKVVLVGHNMEFDMRMLRYAYDHCGMDIHKQTESQVIDTLWQARLTWGHDDSMENFKLGTCCERAGVEMGNAHRALGDVLATAKLLEYLVTNMRNKKSERTAEAAVASTLRKHSFKF